MFLATLRLLNELYIILQSRFCCEAKLEIGHASLSVYLSIYGIQQKLPVYEKIYDASFVRNIIVFFSTPHSRVYQFEFKQKLGSVKRHKIVKSDR